jgi:hypothetical protein
VSGALAFWRIHDHALVSIRARRPHDGKWGNLSADSLMAHIVAADTLYILYFTEEVSAGSGGRGSRAR